MEYFFSNDNNISFKDIINIKDTDNFILKSKERFTLDNYKKPSPDEFYNYEKFCLWGLLNTDKYVFDLLYISRRIGNNYNDVIIPQYTFDSLRNDIIKYTYSLLNNFKMLYPKHSKQFTEIIKIVQQNTYKWF